MTGKREIYRRNKYDERTAETEAGTAKAGTARAETGTAIAESAKD
jgi:hypothetical protein